MWLCSYSNARIFSKVCRNHQSYLRNPSTNKSMQKSYNMSWTNLSEILKLYSLHALTYKVHWAYSYANNNKISRKQNVQVLANGLFISNTFAITELQCYKEQTALWSSTQYLTRGKTILLNSKYKHAGS